MSTIAFQEQEVRPLDALWSLFKSQPKAVRKAFAKRLMQEEVETETLRQEILVKQSLTRAFRELNEAEEKGVKLPDAHDLFKK